LIPLAIDQVLKINNGKTALAAEEESDEEETSDDEQPPVKKRITIFNVVLSHLTNTNIHIHIHKLINML